ncbi:uncharacterized protein SPPG_08284 [Spizellomyces punctatus DAOM BR117]|uniref:Uncharacterized protein n=1 Tax=Spizellomyces punctatus (strain DAOM BR117) TaxID=645134 RepID=A0A0L0H4E8_SPIPD|nr:uncharacterized protein SPPG_08284 [Spizellomyces punctatus DAOM BR117]KNC96385.1 hypothetical protein SPPG_08284 [Spizellomyces punctatus DAOM BR117]|eukprot:XP_016604425.1 hypothetical protein SPPG_08284 [Spizellomyces punctatus DAOM BR117]
MGDSPDKPPAVSTSKTSSVESTSRIKRPRAASDAQHKVGLAFVQTMHAPGNLSRRTSQTQMGSERGSVYGERSEGGRDSVVSSPSVYGRSSVSGSLGLALGAAQPTGAVFATLARQLSSDTGLLRKGSIDAMAVLPPSSAPPLPPDQAKGRDVSVTRVALPSNPPVEPQDEYPDPDDLPEDDNSSSMIVTRAMLGSRQPSKQEIELSEEQIARVASWIGDLVINESIEEEQHKEIPPLASEDGAGTPDARPGGALASNASRVTPASDEKPPNVSVNSFRTSLTDAGEHVPSELLSPVTSESETKPGDEWITHSMRDGIALADAGDTGRSPLNSSLPIRPTSTSSTERQQQYLAEDTDPLLEEVDQLHREVIASEEEPLLGGRKAMRNNTLWWKMVSCFDFLLCCNRSDLEDIDV